MARKVNTSQTPQTMRGNAGIANRQAPLLASAIDMVQRRSRAVKINAPGRRLQITVDDSTLAQIPQFVKITHAD